MSKKNKTNEQSEEEKRAAEYREMKKHDVTGLKEEIFKLREQLSQTLNKRDELQSKIATDYDNHLKSTYTIETEIKKQEEQLMVLEETQNKQKEKFQGEMMKKKKNWDLEFENILKDHQQEKTKKIEQRKHWEEKVKFLKQYPDRKIEYQATIAKLDGQLQQMRICQEKDINKIQHKHKKTRIELEKNTQNEIENIKKQEVNKLEEKMTKQQHIKKENELMQQQIELCEDQKKVLEEECENLKMEIEHQKTKMSKDLLGGQANQTYERSLRIIQLEGKITKLKNYLSQETERLEKQYQKLDELYNKQQEDLNLKIGKIQGWLRMKERDLKKLKACEQMVLNQRSVLESYLLQVFYEHQQLDVHDERNITPILRYLFMKINSKKPPTTYKNYLSQSTSSIKSGHNQDI